MKQLFISLVVFICTNDIFGQKNFEQKMLMYEQEIFEAPNDSMKNSILLQKFNFSLQHLDYKRSYIELRRVREIFIFDSLAESNFFWNAALISKLSGDFQYANIYFDSYLDFTNDTSLTSSILGVLIKSDIDSAEFSQFITDYSNTAINDLTNCFNELFAFQLKRKWAYIFSSYIVPGTGTILTGDLYNGIGSLATISGAGYGILQLAKSKLYLGTGLWGYLILSRVYFGNIRLTVSKVNSFEKKKKYKLACDCQRKANQILNKYPIDFRLNE